MLQYSDHVHQSCSVTCNTLSKTIINRNLAIYLICNIQEYSITTKLEEYLEIFKNACH